MEIEIGGLDQENKEIVAPSASETLAKDKTYGLTHEEETDPNKINVTIADTQAPLIILFGPRACGKTMTVIRLTRYLNKHGYVVAPVRSFRPNYDEHYQRICNEFDNLVTNTEAADSTYLISFMLLEVLKDGRRICQILEAPGEFYFDPKTPNAPFPNYFNTITNCNIRKIWTLMIEPDWEDERDRMNYARRITTLSQKLRPTDHVIFLFNKIDKTNFVRGLGRVNEQAAMKEVQYLYPGVFMPFRNQNPITSWLSPYRFDFVPFQTGNYTKTADNNLTYQQGPDEYPARLWKTILKYIRG